MTLAELRELHNNVVLLYDPPVGGKTPLDGAGNPRTSRVRAIDVGAKIAAGFTQNPIGGAETPRSEPPSPAPEPPRRGRA